MKEADIFWFIPFAVFLYLEIKHLSRYRMFKKQGVLKSASIIYIYQMHNAAPVYKLKIKDGGYPYSKHRLKTTTLSALYPKLLKKDFDVFLLEEYPYCILANPAFIVLNFLFVIIIGVATVCLIIYDHTSHH